MILSIILVIKRIWRRGLNDLEYRFMLHNQDRCIPPSTLFEVKGICRSLRNIVRFIQEKNSALALCVINAAENIID